MAGSDITRRIWFHRSRAAVWVLLTIAALRWWPDSVAFVIVMSGYANVVSDWSAAEAADDRAVLDRLRCIEQLLRDNAREHHPQAEGRLTVHPRRYRRKIPEVEAIRYDGGNVVEIAEWVGGHLLIRPGAADGEPGSISVGHSMAPVRPGDYVVRDRHSEHDAGGPAFYPMVERVFLATYEPVDFPGDG